MVVKKIIIKQTRFVSPLILNIWHQFSRPIRIILEAASSLDIGHTNPINVNDARFKKNAAIYFLLFFLCHFLGFLFCEKCLAWERQSVLYSNLWIKWYHCIDNEHFATSEWTWGCVRARTVIYGCHFLIVCLPDSNFKTYWIEKCEWIHYVFDIDDDVELNSILFPSLSFLYRLLNYQLYCIHAQNNLWDLTEPIGFMWHQFIIKQVYDSFMILLFLCPYWWTLHKVFSLLFLLLCWNLNNEKKKKTTKWHEPLLCETVYLTLRRKCLFVRLCAERNYMCVLFLK